MVTLETAGRLTEEALDKIGLGWGARQQNGIKKLFGSSASWSSNLSFSTLLTKRASSD
jgi:hypothetical protein